MPKYAGGCHCQKVRYEVDVDLGEVMSCNCSICAKKGYLLAFVGESQFKLLSGKQELTDYQFHKKQIHHLFCKTCGVSSFGRGVGPDKKTVYCINARCLDQVDHTKLAVRHVDGKNL